jgi:hypothetical protein
MSGRKNRSKKSAAAAAQGQSKLTFGLTGAITFGTDDARKAKRPKVRSAEQISQGVNANMRSSPEGQKLQKEYLQRQVHKFNLLRTKRDKDKVQQDLLEFECTSTFADRTGAVTTTTRRAVKDLDDGQPQVACCVLWMHFSLL